MSTNTQERLTPAETPFPTSPKRSVVEGFKEASRQLRGTIALELVNPADHFPEADKQLLKFHGSYQQEDRDARKNRKKEGTGKHHMFMVRCKIPGGRLTAQQYLDVDDLAGKYANSTIRLTTRQGIQFHGILKDHLKDTIAGINACLLSTLGACGDVNRNVMACPAPHHDAVHDQLQQTAVILAAHLAPRSKAYHEIWLNGQPMNDPHAETDVEPIYGKVYLPRKFKIGLAIPEDNCVDIHAQDLGLLAIVENGAVVGHNVLVGGGMGMTHGNHNTFPHLAKPICYVPSVAVVNAAEAVVRLFKDHGNRADRKRARIKYLVHDWGVEKFRTVLAGYVGGQLESPRPIQVSDFDSHLGWQEQGDGRWYFGLSVENGRIKDEGTLRLRTGLRKIVERFQPPLRLTAQQDILLCDLDANARVAIDNMLAEHGILSPDKLSTVQKHSMACPAIPTCGLAISESERALPGIIDQLEVELKRLGLENERFSVRMTGCPNGCARPYQADIGIVGRSGEKFSLFVGGRVQGDRLNFMLKDLVHRDDLVPTLTVLLEHFKQERLPAEAFGDYCHRLGLEKLVGYIELLAKSAQGYPLDETEHKTNGHVRLEHKGVGTNGEGSRFPAATKTLSVESPAASAVASQSTSKLRSESFLAGASGEELVDYRFHYASDGKVRSTTVCFYGSDLRAASAHEGLPLTRQATYRGQVDPFRLHAARKLRDTLYVGNAGRERKDYCVHYHDDGSAARTSVFYYQGNLRALEAGSGAAVTRITTFDGGFVRDACQ